MAMSKHRTHYIYIYVYRHIACHYVVTIPYELFVWCNWLVSIVMTSTQMLRPGGYLLYCSLHIPHLFIPFFIFFYHWQGRCGRAAGVCSSAGALSAMHPLPALSGETALPLQPQAHSWTLQVYE